jgi:hypothetical protein
VAPPFSRAREQARKAACLSKYIKRNFLEKVQNLVWLKIKSKFLFLFFEILKERDDR